jgi:hypothetical protein
LISLIHEPSGPRLVVYKLSSDGRPHFEPSTIGSTPPFEDRALLVHGPGDGNRNRLGGFFNVFSKSPSRAEATLAESPDGRRSLKLSMLRAAEGFCGMWIHLFDFGQPPDDREYLDATPFEVLSLWVRGETGDEEVLLKIADVGWELKGDALAIGRVGDFLPAGRIETEWQQAVIPLDFLDGGLDRTALASLVFECTEEGGATVYIRNVALSPTARAAPPLGKPESDPHAPSGLAPADSAKRDPSAGPLASVKLPKATWVWNTSSLLHDAKAQTELRHLLEEQGIARVFLQLPGLPGETGELGVEPWDEAALRDLIRELRQAGTTVYALDGFRSYALKVHHQTVLGVIDRVIEHNRESPPEARFVGVHHDIEPYLLPGFHGTRRDRILVDYLDLIAESARRLRDADLAYGVDIPFWYDAPDEDTYELVEVDFRGKRKPVSEHVIDLVDEVTVMDYRTTAYGAGPALSRRGAEPGSVPFTRGLHRRGTRGRLHSPGPSERAGIGLRRGTRRTAFRSHFRRARALLVASDASGSGPRGQDHLCATWRGSSGAYAGGDGAGVRVFSGVRGFRHPLRRESAAPVGVSDSRQLRGRADPLRESRQPRQLLGELNRALDARLWFFDQQTDNQLGQGLRHVVVHLHDRARLDVQHFGDQRNGRPGIQGQPTGQALVQDHAHGVEVASGIHVLP